MGFAGAASTGIIAPVPRSIGLPGTGGRRFLFLRRRGHIVEPKETIVVDTKTVACNGDAGASGHPRVFLHMGKTGHVDCPYCGRCYLLDADDGGLR